MTDLDPDRLRLLVILQWVNDLIHHLEACDSKAANYTWDGLVSSTVEIYSNRGDNDTGVLT